MARVVASNLRNVLAPAKPTIYLQNPSSLAGTAKFVSSFFEVEADVAIAASSTEENGYGLRLGFTQLQWIETNRAQYRGLRPDEGSIRILRDRIPSRPSQICRDVRSASDVFSYSPSTQSLKGYSATNPLNLDLTGMPLPKTINVSHADAPSDYFALQRRNTITAKMNYLHWPQLEFHFCTVLLLKRHDSSLHQLQHFYWNVHWQAGFTTAHVRSGSAVVALSTTGLATSMTIGHFIEGSVQDARFSALITLPVVQTCNIVAGLESVSPIVQERRRW